MKKLLVISSITNAIGGYMYLKLYQENTSYKKIISDYKTKNNCNKN